MKKIMIAAAIVCAALMSNAAVANWKIQANTVCDGTGSDESYATGLALVFDAGVTTQSALYTMIMEGTKIDDKTAGFVGSMDLDEGAFQITKVGYDEQGSGMHTFYFAVITDDKVYFSNEKDVTAGTTSTAKLVNFGAQDGSTAAATATYAGAGAWAATIPEPTSGLLLLLGMAGLALRRRQA